MTLFEELLRNSFMNNKYNMALVCDERSYTYEQLEESTINLAEKMKNIGITKGDKVIVVNKHPLQFTLILLTLVYIEAIPMPVYAKMGLIKLENMIEFYEVNYIIMPQEDIRILLKYDYALIDSIENIVVYSYAKEKDISLEKVRLILFTSGTTSTPKAIMLTQKNILSNVEAISEYLKLSCRDSILLIKDLSHSSSIIGELFVGLVNGCKIVMTTQLPLTSIILKLMVKQKISVFFAVPTLLKGIMSFPNLNEFDLSNLSIINFYGASINHTDIAALLEIFPNTNIIYSYGQTEASPRVTYIEKKELVKRPASCGSPIKDVRIQIVNEKGKEILPFNKGQVVVEGPNVMYGYYKNELRTQQVVKDGKLFTGDVGYVDEEGFLYITGRVDNMIISAGKNIYPEEIEGVITAFDDILESLVVAEKKKNETIELIAYVVVKESVQLDYGKLFSYCRDNMELYKIPREIIVVPELDKTPSGKIKRNQKL